VEDWLNELAGTMRAEALGAEEVEALLEIARDVAHRVERKATPLATFLLGVGVQRRIAEGASRADALAAATADLRALLPPEE
jgi:hypothetical protein